MEETSRRAEPMLVALEGSYPLLRLPRDVPEWSLRAKDQLLIHAARFPRPGDLVVVTQGEQQFLTRFPLECEGEVEGVITCLMRLRP